MSADLLKLMAAEARRVDDFLALRYQKLDPLMQHPIAHALQGGKKLRAFLVHASAQLYDLDGVLPAMAAIEALHAYSLVHDDLPAMDDDDLRRGRPTVHKAFDEATAILAGDALQTLSFELLCDGSEFPAHLYSVTSSAFRTFRWCYWNGAGASAGHCR